MRRLKNQIPVKNTRKRTRAASADVLGTNFGDTGVPKKWKDCYRRLNDLRNLFTDKKKDLVKDATEERPSYSMHLADAGTDTYDQDWAFSMLSSEQSALYEIEAAMGRIKDGTYGICEITGKPIERARLEAIPWTRYSLAGVKQVEEEGKEHRTKLGKRGSWQEVTAGEKMVPAGKEEE
jgi:RNA polymerase-binding transcription factor DksA